MSYNKKRNKIAIKLTAIVLTIFAALSPMVMAFEAYGRNTPIALSANEGKWDICGLGGFGATYSPEINPWDSNMMVISCDMCGDYLTYDGGKSFEMIEILEFTRDYHFSDENTLYAGSNALYKSSDKGKSFNRILPAEKNITCVSKRGFGSSINYESSDCFEPYHQIEAVTTHPQNSDMLFVLSKRNYNSDSAFYYSSDSGASFEKLMNYQNSTLFKILCVWGKTDVCYIAHDKGILEYNLLTKSARSVYNGEITDVCVLKDTFYVIENVCDGDFFNSVYKLDKNFQNAKNISSSCIPLWKLSDKRFTQISAADDGTIVVGVAGYNSFGIATTKDEGKTWKASNGDLWSDAHFDVENPSYMQTIGYTGGSPLGISICKSDSNKIIWTNLTDVFFTSNGGVSWRQLESQPVAPATDQRAATYTSTGLDVTSARYVSVDPNDADHLIAGFDDVGTAYSYDGGNSWSKTEGLKYSWLANSYGTVFIPEKQGLVFTLWAQRHDIPTAQISLSDLNATDGGISVSTDGGVTHTPIVSSVIPEKCIPTDIKYLTDKVSGKKSLYVCLYGGGVIRSNDLGQTWEVMNSGLESDNLYAYKIETDNYGNLYLIITDSLNKNGQLYKSENGGQGWQRLSLPNSSVKDGLAFDFPTDLAFDSKNNLYLCFVTSQSCNNIYPYSWICGGVYKTINDGNTWTCIVNESYSMSALTYDKNSDRLYMAGYYLGAVYYDGESLFEVDGFDFSRANDISVSGNTLYVSSRGASIWRYQVDSTPKLLAIEGCGVYVDEKNKLVWGLSVGYGSLHEVLTSTNGADFSEPNGIGTGTVICVTDHKNLTSVYTVVILGDVNGDGISNANDAVILSMLINNMLSKESVSMAMNCAADVNRDGKIDTDDEKMIEDSGLFLIQIEQGYKP